MSYRIFTVTGIGVKIDKNPTKEGIEKLLSLAEEVSEYYEQNGYEVEVDDEYERMNYYGYGVAGFLADVMEECEHLCFTFADDFDGDHYVLYTPCYPWEMTEQDRILTYESVCNMFRKYTKILFGEEIIADDYSVENGG